MFCQTMVIPDRPTGSAQDPRNNQCERERFPDTENIRFVFAAVKDTILQSNLKEYNLV